MKPRPDKTFVRRVLRWLPPALLVVAPNLDAQARAEAPLVFRLPASARLAGMGNAGVAANDGDALHYNPAMILFARGGALSMHAYGDHAVSGSLGSVSAAGAFTYALGAQFLRWRGNVPLSPVEETPGSLFEEGNTEAMNAVFTAALARTFRGLRIGASVKYGEVRVGDVADGVVAVDVGIARPLGPGALAIVVQNLGAGARYADHETVLPRRFGIGFGGGMVPFNEFLDLGAQLQLLVERDGFVRAAAGGEIGYVPIEGVAFVFRAGLRNPREADEEFYTAGIGLNVDRYSFDYAVEPFAGGHMVHRVGVRVR